MNNPPAFPTLVHDDDRNVSVGMTLRDYFAAAAMQGCVAIVIQPAVNGCNPEDERSFPALAEFAYQVADAMMKAREQ